MPENAMLNQAPKPQTWGDVLASFGRHVASLPAGIVNGMIDAATLPGRAYRGEVPQDQMLPEAINFAGNVALGGYMAPKPAGALGMSGGGKGIKAYHGSPHDFDRFSMDKIGTGEGAQAYGHGLYFAENEGVARSYKEALTGVTKNPDVDVANALKFGASLDDIIEMFGRNSDEYSKRVVESARSGSYLNPPPPGRLYEVRINAEPDQFLDWDKPLSQQSESVQNAVESLASGPLGPDRVISRTYDDMAGIDYKYAINKPENVAKFRDAGIPGIRYLDQGSRGAGEGSRNYVVFDDSLIEILRKYGLLGMIGGGAAMSGSGEGQAAQ